MQRNMVFKQKTKYYIAYTILFAVIMSFIFINFIINSTTIIGANDSLVQHYPNMLKIKQFYENALESLFTHKSVELIDFDTYFGLDVISTFQYYGLGNPLYLLTIFFSDTTMPYVFTAFVFIKIYLGGIVFSALCFQCGKKEFFTLMGTIIYITNPFVLASLEQMCFLDVLYQLPLLVIGFNQILNGKKGKVFIGAVTLTAFNGYYFLYIMTIMLAVYGVTVIIGRNKDIKEILEDGISKLRVTIINYIVGVMLAAPVLLPAIIGFFDSFRNGSSTVDIGLIYDAEYYISEIVYTFFYNSNTYFSLNIVVMFLMIILFAFCKGKYRNQKMLIVCALIGAQIPVVGMIMNGFAYPSNRWLFGFYMLVAFACADVLEHMITKSFKTKVVACVLICVVVSIQPYVYAASYEKVCLSTNEIDYIKKSSFDNRIPVQDRMDGDTEWIDNASLFYDVSKAQVYTSIIPKKVMDSELKVDLASVGNTNIIEGLDSRAELTSLFNIRYFLTDKEKADIPYGFEAMGINEYGKYLFENKKMLPFGYTYGTYVSEESIEEASGLERSWIALNHAIVSKEDEKKVDISGIGSIDTYCEKAAVDIKTEDNNKVIVTFDNIINSEVYLKCDIEYDSNVEAGVTAGNIEKIIKFANRSRPWYISREYKVFHLGYFDNISEIILPEGYQYKDIEIYYHSMKDYEKQIDELGKYHLENVEFNVNEILGNIEVPEKRLLCLSIPNIKGWKAYIDEQEAEIVDVNGMFAGINIEPGRHTVRMTYFTPGLQEGIVLFFVAIFILVCMSYRRKYVRRKSDGKNNGTGRDASKA